VAIVVEVPERRADLVALIRLHDAVHAGRRARWTADLGIELPLLTGESPFAAGRRIRPFVARDNGELAARAVAVLDDRYNRHWNERLGHVVLFEAMPDAGDATRALLDAACAWLAGEGATAARTGFGMFDFPFVTDAYDPLPPSVLRHNPPGYHALLKDAGFAPERGFVDYKLAVTPALAARWETMAEAGRRAGFALTRLREVPFERRASDLHLVWDDAFRAHWGYTPFTEEELSLVIASLAPAGMLDYSVLAYRDGEPLGALWLVPETSELAALAPGHRLGADERLNTLAIAVREPARRQGLNVAMAALGYLELARRGARFLSYTLVLDDNWPSRRTAEKLGATVCAHYVCYRRELPGRA
jgi:GNAT superfamily N-acetyltransferase